MVHKRCAQCGGKFGLVRQRWHQSQFCCKRCRETFLDKVAREKDRLRKWLLFLRPA